MLCGSCGKGKVLQRLADDDWNRTKYETPAYYKNEFVKFLEEMIRNYSQTEVNDKYGRVIGFIDF